MAAGEKDGCPGSQSAGGGRSCQGALEASGSASEVVYQRRRGLRRLRMSFDYANRLVVGVPWNCSRAEAERFVEANEAWIRGQREVLAPVLSLGQFLAKTPYLTLRGRRHRILVRRASGGRSFWILDERRGEGLFQIGPSGGFESELLRLARRVAARELESRTRDLAGFHGFRPGRVTVRDQRSRWGSCSRAGTISLNWRLILCVPGVQDYVILHELAHLSHHDHSRRFHELLDRLDPGRRAHENELDRIGAALMRVGRG